MTLQNFVAKNLPTVKAVWLNLIDNYVIGTAAKAPNEQTAAEATAGIVPTNLAYYPGWSARYGELDAAAFGGGFTAIHGLKPFNPPGSPSGNPYGGFMVNAASGRVNIGTNWTSASGLRRQMYQTGFATMIQLDENGEIGFYTYAVSLAQGVNWEPKYSLIVQRNGRQWVNSSGANTTWTQLISTGANTNDQGFGTDRLVWGCVATAGDIIAGSAVGDICYSGVTGGCTFRWSGDNGATQCFGISPTAFVLNGAGNFTAWEFRGSGTTRGFVGYANVAGSIVAGSAVGDLVLRTQGNAFRLSVDSGATTTILVDSAKATYFPDAGTTASAANAFLDNATGNKILRSTSSLKYKTDVRALGSEKAERILSLTPIEFRSLCSADIGRELRERADTQEPWTYYGLSAEEVAEIDPRFVFFDSQGAPDGVQYDRLVVPLIHLAKRQRDQIKSLEARLGALEQRLSGL